jgi:virginiamycin B lyase
VQRLDPHTNAVVAAVSVNVPCNGLASGFGSIWTASCTGELVRINPTTHSVVTRIRTTIAADGEGQVAVGFGSVWVAGGDGRLLRIDPTTNRISSTIKIRDGSSAVVTGYGSVWVTNPEDNSVTRIDPTRRKVVHMYAVGPHPQFLAAGSGALWVLNQGDGTVTRLAPASGAESHVDAESAGDGGCVAAGLNAVWLTIPNRPITRIDAASSTITEQFTGEGGDCITTGFGSVWLVNNALGNVYRIAPQ